MRVMAAFRSPESGPYSFDASMVRDVHRLHRRDAILATRVARRVLKPLALDDEGGA